MGTVFIIIVIVVVIYFIAKDGEQQQLEKQLKTAEYHLPTLARKKEILVIIYQNISN